MIPVDFPEKTGLLFAPYEMEPEDCSDLIVFRNQTECISCWEMTEEEKQEFKETGKIWIRVLSSDGIPPVALQVASPFERE